MAKIPEKFFEHINGAFPATPCLLGTASPRGEPQISPKGSMMVFDGDTLAYWERGRRKALENLKANPNVMVWYRNPALRESGVLPAGGVARFYGRAEVHEDGAMREAVWEKVIQPEKNQDAEKKGAAVLIRLDRAEQLNGKPLE